MGLGRRYREVRQVFIEDIARKARRECKLLGGGFDGLKDVLELYDLEDYDDIKLGGAKIGGQEPTHQKITELYEGYTAIRKGLNRTLRKTENALFKKSRQLSKAEGLDWYLFLLQDLPEGKVLKAATTRENAEAYLHGCIDISVAFYQFLYHVHCAVFQERPELDGDHFEMIRQSLVRAVDGELEAVYR